MPLGTVPQSTPAPSSTGLNLPPGVQPIIAKDGTQLDPAVVNIARAVRTVESNNDYNAKGDNGQSFGAYQFNGSNFQDWAKKYGLNPSDTSPVNQDKVAYFQMKSYKDMGFSPEQVAAAWNAGPGKASDGSWQKNVGFNPKTGIKFDTPGYVGKVINAFNTIKTGGQPQFGGTSSSVGQQQQLSQSQMADSQNADQTGAAFPAAVGQDSVLGTVGKTLGNLPGSAFNFVKGAINTLNPLTIAGNIGKIGQGLGEISKMPGGIGGYLAQAPFTLPGSAYQTVVPQAGRDVVSGIGNVIKGDMNAAGTNFESAQRNVVNDPFGQVAPFVLGAKGLAEGAAEMGGARALKASGIDTAGMTADEIASAKANLVNEGAAGKIAKAGQVVSDTIDKGISKVGSAVTAPIRGAFGFAGDVLGKAGKFTASQLTGMEPGTIKTIAENPEQFTKGNMATIDRSSLGQTVQSALQKRISDLKDTGEAYAPIRNSDTVVKVSPNMLEDTIKETTGLDLTKTPTETPKGGLPTIDESGKPTMEPGGKWQSSGAAKIRDASDVRAIQTFYNKYQSLFDSGKMTTNEYLNMRSDLKDLAKFERVIGKSKPIEAATQIIRGKLNTALRPQIEGLSALDKSFEGQSAELKALSKGLVDKNGQLTDTALNRIANATGKGKDAALARLEEVAPGITKKIQILKAVEDVQHAAGNKVGTYARGIGMAGLGGGILTGNIPLMAGSIAEMILANPENATAIIRKYGQSAPLIQAVVAKLKSAGSAVNNAPSTLAVPLSLGGSKP